MTIKELEIKFNDLKAEVQTKVDQVKSKGKVWLIVAGILAVLVIALLITVFRNKGEVSQEYLDDMKAKDEKIEMLEGKVSALELARSQIDSNIKGLDEKLKNNRPTETRIIHQYEKIPADVRNLDRDKLRNEVTNFGQ
jgi:hypothetical protein